MAMPISPERFWSRVNKSECWEWMGARNEKGYGVVAVDGKTPKAHRVAWELENGPIPAGVCVLHRCDNPPCCNPAHLFLGSKKDNNRDMISKGRRRVGGEKTPVELCAYQRGEAHHSARLTVEIVRAIRVDRARGMSYSKIASKHGVAISSAFKIANREQWAHVKDIEVQQ